MAEESQVSGASAPDVPELLARVREGSEESRAKALLELREQRDLPPEVVQALVTLSSADPSRDLRILARDILKEKGQGPVAQATMRHEAEEKDRPRGNPFQALISFSSAGTGLLATALSVFNYYTLGQFPFPEPLEVLFWINLVLTAPYVAVAVALIFPGRLQRKFALGYGIFSLLLCVAAMAGLRPLFMWQWAIQFSSQTQAMYYNFLAPFQVGAMLLPVILGQTMLLYFLQRELGIFSGSGGTKAPAPTT